jgi:3-carboxy-cis,cis-muconate cycloisomerase
MREVFSDASLLQGMLDFEAALASAEARCGVIPAQAAGIITRVCGDARLNTEALGRAAVSAGNLAIPLVRELTALVAQEDGNASGWVHWGATSQDAIDTGLVLQLRRALALLEDDLVRLIRAQAALVRKERGTVMTGRTWLQQALPITFGLKVAGWLDGNLRHLERIKAARSGLAVQFGGAVGTLASLGSDGLAVRGALAEALQLNVPDLPWHSQRDRLVEIACGVGMLVGALGKTARDMALLMQTELGEASEPAAPGRGGSSTMPHKRNPVAAAPILAAALRVPGLVATLLSAMVQEHERGLGGWHAEWEVLPEIFRLAAGALSQSAAVAEALSVDRKAMAANLERSQGVLMAEAVTMALGRFVGRGTAHALLEKAAHEATTSGQPLRTFLEADSTVSQYLTPKDLEHLLDPSNYLGSTQQFVDAVLTRADRI